MALVITAAEVSAVLALSLNDADVLQAQGVVEVVTGADLTSPNPAERFNAADLQYLRLAVQWQVAYLDANPGVLTRLAGLTSASANGAAVTFDGAVADGYLAPLAARVLRRLSWLADRGVVAGVIRSVDMGRGDPPSPWVRI